MSAKSSLVRKLVPKSYHFDGYNELNCPNARDKPFFSDNVIPMGNHYLTVCKVNQDTIILEFSSICPEGKITFTPYTLTLEDFVKKLQEAVQNDCDFIYLEIEQKTDYSTFYYFHSILELSELKECHNCPNFLSVCSKKFLKNQASIFTAAISFNPEDIKEALAAYYQITKKDFTTEGVFAMKKRNNIFGMNFEFGLSKDPNLSSTLMGVAVRNTENGNWYVYDTTNNSLKNIAGLKMGSFPVALLPSTTVSPGDLIKYQGKYFRVKGFNPSAKTITLIGAADGVITERVPEESIFAGMTLYTKVVAFDAKSLTDKNSNQNISSNLLAAMCMMQWSKGDSSEFSLDNINEDSFNGLGMFVPMLMQGNSNIGNMFTNENGSINFPMLMALGSATDDSSDSTMMQTLVISQLLGGGGTNSPFSNMMDAVLPGASTAADSEVFCEKCNKKYSADTLFCPKCGSKTKSAEAATAEVFCEKCKVSYPAGTNFCPKCGGKTKSISTTCRKCGAKLMKDSAFCHKCGAKVEQNTCPKCGRTVKDDEAFCSKCGTPINAAPAVSEDDSTQEEPDASDSDDSSEKVPKKE